MFCHNCGTALDEGVKFCPNCGTPIEVPVTEEPVEQAPVYEEPVMEQPVYQQPAAPVVEQPVYQQPAAPASEPVYRAPVVNTEAAALSTPILVFGIMGLAFACTFWLSFLGIIFSAIGKGKVKAFLAAGGQLSGKAKVGSILAKVGLILGIVLTVFFVIYLIVVIAVAASHGYRY